MASDYTPTTVTQGFGAETIINQNFNDIKTSLDKMLSRLQSNDNAMGQDLDMGNFQILNLPDSSDPLDPVLLKELNSLAVVEVVQPVTFSSAISIDANQVTFAKITLTGNTTITFTGTPNDGQPLLLALRQDGVGSRIVTWEARARFSTDVPSPTLSTAAAKLDYVVYRYNADDNKFDLMAVNKGF